MTDEKPRRGRPLTGTAKTPAQHQSEFKARRMRNAASFAGDTGQGSTRLDVWLPTNAMNALIALSRKDRCSNAETLYRLLMDADKAVTTSMTDEELDTYHGAK